MPAAAAYVGTLFGATGATATAVGGVAIGSAVAYGANALLNKPKFNMPPNPLLGQSKIDQAQQDAEAQARKRASIAGGLQSTVGTSEAGSALNPTTLQNKTLLGA